MERGFRSAKTTGAIMAFTEDIQKEQLLNEKRHIDVMIKALNKLTDKRLVRLKKHVEMESPINHVHYLARVFDTKRVINCCPAVLACTLSPNKSIRESFWEIGSGYPQTWVNTYRVLSSVAGYVQALAALTDAQIYSCVKKVLKQRKL
jgi:hypothetical protein